jgi:hypothetical protein
VELVWSLAVAQAASRQLHTTAAWVRTLARSCGICDGLHWGRFSLSTSISLSQYSHRLLHTHLHPFSRAVTVGQIVADVAIGLSLTPPQELN